MVHVMKWGGLGFGVDAGKLCADTNNGPSNVLLRQALSLAGSRH